MQEVTPLDQQRERRVVRRWGQGRGGDGGLNIPRTILRNAPPTPPPNHMSVNFNNKASLGDSSLQS